MRRDLLSARPSSLKEAISHRYLRKPPPSFFVQNFSSENVRKGLGSEIPNAEVAKHAMREDLSDAKAKASSARNTQRRKRALAVKDPPSPSLIALPCSKSRATPPRGGHPRPIANGLQHGTCNGLPTEHGARNAKKCGQKGTQNHNREESRHSRHSKSASKSTSQPLSPQ